MAQNKKIKRLKLKPSAKPHKRYFLIRGNREEIESSILDFVGFLGWAKASPVFVQSKSIKKGQLVLAVNREEIDKIRGAFAISTEEIEVLKVSGTLKGLWKK